MTIISSDPQFNILRNMEIRLNELHQQMNSMFRLVQENMSQNSIMGPEREIARNEVVEYIATVPDFEAKALGGGYSSRLKLLNAALEYTRLKPEDIAIEFGVCTGESLALMSIRCPGKVYGFDSFEGLPHDENGWKKGQFAHSMQLDYKVGPNTELVKGWFSDTLPGFVEKIDLSKVRFVHIDSDLYSSAKEIFEILIKRLPQEVILVFDEYWNFKGWKNIEHKAFLEFLAETGRTFKHLYYMDCGQQMAGVLHAQK